mgnify:CR=1 FL=1
MIEKMNKINVICVADDRADTIDKLGELGIVHVEEVKAPSSTELDETVTYRDRLHRALMLLQDRNEPLSASEGDNERKLHDIVDDTLETSHEINQTREKLNYWRRAYSLVEPWGSFSKDELENLKKRGFEVRLCYGPESQLPEVPDEAVLTIFKREKKYVYFSIIAEQGVELPEDLPEVQLPEETRLDVIQSHIDGCNERIDELNKDLDRLAAYYDSLSEHLEEIDERIEFMRARETMGEAQTLCYLSGYVPEKNVETLREAAHENGWGLQVTEPDENDPAVPTKISLPRWVEPIRMVFKAMGIAPGYREVDISAWFMVFLSVFFAMLVGDAGYGALFLGGTLLARKKFKDAPSQPFWLIGVFGACTMVWGALNGTYFGIQTGLGPLSALKIGFLTGEQGGSNTMRLCFFLGALQLSIAHCWNAIVYGKSLRSVKEIGWGVIVWGNFFLARLLVSGDPVQSQVAWLYIPGVTTVLLVTIIKDFGFVNLLLMVFGFIDAFVDVVSYIRLYAVGMATVAVAQSFNNMALGLDMPVWIEPLAMGIILLFGHTLNLLLASMGVLVHGVRLNVLEFSQHLNMEWAGKLYAPLQKRKKPVDADVGQ